MQLKIVATTGRALGEAVEIHAAKFYIGSHDNCQLRPDLDGLAGIHALIERRGISIFLRDFGGEGGTGINDRVIYGRETEIFHGDLIQIGPMVLTLAYQDRVDATFGRGHHGTRGLDHPHHEAPVGWPFLKGLAGEPIAAAPGPPALSTAAVVPPAPHLVPRPEPEHRPAAGFSAPAVAEIQPEPEHRPAPQPYHAPAVAAVEAAPRITSPAPPPPLAMFSKPTKLRALCCREVDGVLVASILTAGLEAEETVSPVRHELRSLIEGEAPSRMVIDLGRTKHLSSRAVGVILAHFQAMERQGGTLRVCQVSPEIRPVLNSMRLSMVIDIFPTVEEAVAEPWE